MSAAMDLETVDPVLMDRLGKMKMKMVSHLHGIKTEMRWDVLTNTRTLEDAKFIRQLLASPLVILPTTDDFPHMINTVQYSVQR